MRGRVGLRVAEILENVEAAAVKSIAEPRRRGGQAREFLAVGALVAVAWLPVLVGVTTRALAGWAAAAVLAFAVERAIVRFPPRVLVAALLASGAFVPSGLVTDSTHYLPVAVTAGALSIRFVRNAWRSKHLERPAAEPVAVAVGVYLLWALVPTAFSIDHRVSLAYWVGMFAVCALVFWVSPLVIPRREDREFMLAVLGGLGVIVAATVYVLSPLGAISIFGRRVSDYQLIDLTVGGHGTGIHFGKSAGLFLAPLEPSLLMVVAMLALLGWASMRTGRWLWAGRAAIVFLVPAILLTLDRSAWISASIATGVFAVLPAARRSAAVTAGVLCLVFTLSFFGVVANLVGANAIATACPTGCTQPAAGSDEAPLRGGTGLSGREFLWSASVHAITHRPITGYGPGTNVPAIDAYLTGEGLRFKGLTSHDTWLRAAVELGVPGLLFLLVVLLSAAWVFLRAPRDPRPPTERRTGIPDPTRVTFAVSLLGLLGAMTFESFFLGGVNFSNLYLGIALAMMVPPMTFDHFIATLSRRAPQPKPH